jgi:MFS family permease
VHYGWVVAVVTFTVLLVTAGVRATPGILIIPLEQEFGWSRTVISAAIAINIALFGLIGPFAASVMDRWGLRRVVLAALALVAISVALTTEMRNQWQLTLLWGVMVGTGTGVTSLVLAAVVATRWFDERRGRAPGSASAANATGQLVLWLLASPSSSAGGAPPVRWLPASRSSFAIACCSCEIARDLGWSAGQRPMSGSHVGRRVLAPLRSSYHMRSRAFWSWLERFRLRARHNGPIGTHPIAGADDAAS